MALLPLALILEINLLELLNSEPSLAQVQLIQSNNF